MPRVTDEELNNLIVSLKICKDNGVVDPWLMSDGSIIEPLDILLELKELRKYNHNK